MVGEIVGDADVGVVRAQVARILSLDVDGGAFPLLRTRLEDETHEIVSGGAPAHR